MTYNTSMAGAIKVIGHLDGRDAFLQGVDLNECPAGSDPRYQRAWRMAWLQASRDEERQYDYSRAS